MFSAAKKVDAGDAANVAKKQAADKAAVLKKSEAAAKKQAADAAALSKKESADAAAASKKAQAAAKKEADAAAAASKKEADAAAAAAKKQLDIDATKKLDEDFKNPALAKKFDEHPKQKSFIERNPILVAGLSVAAIAALCFGAVVAAKAAELMKLNDKVFTIVSMTNPDSTKPTYVQVTYSPNTEIPKSAKIRISKSIDIQPVSIIDQKHKINKIISKTVLEFTIPEITILATSGEFRLDVNLDDALDEAGKDTVKDITNPVSGFFSDIMGNISKMFGTVGMYLLGFGILIVVFLIIFLIRKLIKVFKG
jgi:hypothetical protein